MNALRRIAKKGRKEPLEMLGKPVPDFSLASTGATPFRLSEQRGSKLVLYFYPKDNTPGCTLEGADFRDLHKQFRKAGAEVYGVSRDALASHQKFKAKVKFPFELLAEPAQKGGKQLG